MSYHIIQRDEWEARYDDGFHDRDLPVNETWLHHSVTIAPDLIPPFDDDYAAVRTLESIGESRFGKGISYTYVITPAGLIFEGHSAHRSGAHTLNRNDIAVAVCWVGRYDTVKPTEALIRATAWLLVELKRTGVIRSARLNGGHGQAPGQATDCPGQFGRAAIPQVNELAAAYERGEVDLGSDEEDDDMKLTDRMENAWGGTPTLEEVFRFIDLRATEAAEAAEAANTKLDALLGRDPAEVDELELAKQLIALGLGNQLGRMPSDQFAALVDAVNDENDRRERERANTEVPDVEPLGG